MDNQDETVNPAPVPRPSAGDAMLRYKVQAELERLDQFIVECALRITEQRLRLQWLRQSGHDTGDSETLLNNLISSLGALHRLRKTVMTELQTPGQ
ncbi:hypothetical protein [Caballeronia sp. S22]|uniref:hypothetical protein n=1 Tax=Caballeronia sp. S22 TaxID=3137182 RepID=UPI0035306436